MSYNVCNNFDIINSSNIEENSLRLCEKIVEISEQILLKNKYFIIGLSGGSVCDGLSPLVNNKSIDWNRWLIFFCDERIVPLDDSDSNYAYLYKKLLQFVSIPIENIIKIDEFNNPDTCSLNYETKIRNIMNEQINFDLVVLGIGPDGHTCSLFPNSNEINSDSNSLISEKKLFIPVIDSPKPPKCRISMTRYALTKCSNILIFANGSQKSIVIQQLISDIKTNEKENIAKQPISVVCVDCLPRSNITAFLDDQCYAMLNIS